MGTVSDFVKRSVDDMTSWWKDRLRGWMASWVAKGVEELFDDFEPTIRDEIKPMLLRFREIEGLPDEYKNIIDKAVEEKSAVQFVALLPMLMGMMIGLAMGAAGPVSRAGSYILEKLVKSYRFDPGTITKLWLRNPELYEKFWQDLRDQGWNEDRVNAGKELAWMLPPAPDLVNWLAKEVFEPSMIAKYGLDAETAEIDWSLFEKIGVSKEIGLNYWRAHWTHASLTEVAEMLRRHLLEEEDVYEWFRLVEIPPFWRDNLMKIMYAWPTRVDVRRFWDMGTVDEARLKVLYEGHGYRGENLDDYMLWTKVYVDLPDLVARCKKGWITEAEVKDRLVADGMSAERAQELWETKFEKSVVPDQVEAERELTKSEIYAGVKKEVFTWDEGLTMLEALGYSAETAQFILEIRVGAGSSPDTYLEMMKWVQDWRKATGMEAKEIPAELIAKEKEYKHIVAEHEKAIREGASQAKIDALGTERATIEYQYRQMVKLHGL